MADILVMFKDSSHVPMVMTDVFIKQIRSSTTGNVYWCADEDEAIEKNIDAEVLFIWGGSGDVPVNYCVNSQKLRWIHSFSAGINPIIDSPIAKLPVKLTNARGIHGKTMALTTIGYITCFLRQFPELFRRQQKHEWNKCFDISPQDAIGQTVVILGAGAIGSEVARMSKGLDMKVIGVKRKVTPLQYFDAVYSDDKLEKVLALADFVVVLMPLMDSTYHLIDMKKLQCMKKTAVLINIARGPVVNEQDLIMALEQGIIGGAALDATEIEPLPPDSPLWDMKNVIITPHCSADSVLYMERAVNMFCENVKCFDAGMPLINEIDMSKQY